jgi:hypothetical protein
MSPKPILKRSVTEPLLKTDPYHTQGYPNRAHGVHFPPSPATRTFSVHSAAAYDRSPIVVTPNNCALPERGGRTYTIDESKPKPSRGMSFALDYHPRALAFASSRSDLPQLIPDLSSDESDGWFPNPPPSTTSFGIHGLAGPASKCNSDDVEMNGYTNCVDALAFLPYPPSSPSQKYQQIESIDPFPHSYSRRRSGREAKRENSSDPDRKPNMGSDTQHCLSAFASLSISASPPSFSTPSRRSNKKRQPKSSHASSTPISVGFGNPDDGCLGGF